MSFSFKVNKDTSVWDKMKKNVSNGSLEEIKLGFFPDSVYGSDNDNLPVAQVVQWQEEGTEGGQGNGSGIPPRPFMRVGFKSSLMKPRSQDWFKASINRIVMGESTFRQEYNSTGKLFVKELQEVIEEWSSPANSPVTIANKGFNDPLIETGFMKDSVDYKIEKKGTD